MNIKPRTFTNFFLVLSLVNSLGAFIQTLSTLLGENEPALVFAWLSAAAGWGLAAVLLVAIRATRMDTRSDVAVAADPPTA